MPSSLHVARTEVHYCLDTYEEVQRQMQQFLKNNTVIDVCGGSECVYGSRAKCHE